MLGYDIFVTDIQHPAAHSVFGIVIIGTEDDNPDRAYGRESLDFTGRPFPTREDTTA